MVYKWFEAHERSSVTALCFVAATNFVLTGGGNDALVRLHNVDSSGKPHLFSREHVNSVNDLDCSESGSSFISGGGDFVVVWDLAKHTKLAKLKGSGKDDILACKYLNADLVASCGSNKELKLHDLRQEQRLRPVFAAPVGNDNLTSLDFGANVVSIGCADGNLYTVDIRNQTLTSDSVSGGSVLGVETHKDVCLLTLEDGSIRLWDTNLAQCRYKYPVLPRLEYKVTSTMVPDLYDDTKHIFAGSETGVLHHLKLGNSTINQLQIQPGKLPQSKIISIVKYSPFKNVLAASGGDGKLHVWENIL